MKVFCGFYVLFNSSMYTDSKKNNTNVWVNFSHTVITEYKYDCWRIKQKRTQILKTMAFRSRVTLQYCLKLFGMYTVSAHAHM